MTGPSAAIVFPHQLFEHHPAPADIGQFILVEETLFFRQYPFHKQKLAFHRASMKAYASYLEKKGKQVHYVESKDSRSDIRKLLPDLINRGIRELHYTDPVDDWLHERLRNVARKEGISLVMHDSPMFLNSSGEIEPYFQKQNKLKQASFYRRERKKRKILVDENGKPAGGKWSFDAENRKAFPRDREPPQTWYPEPTPFHQEAREYVERHFPGHPGDLPGAEVLPVTTGDTRRWIGEYISTRFHGFGPFQDAIHAGGSNLHHSQVSPMLNAGLITPGELLEMVLNNTGREAIPLNSLEGYVRQILGWREYIRGIYLVRGRYQRSHNFWGFSRQIPPSFWTGETGILPVDLAIRKVLGTGYAHHIERLMVLGNIMLLCEFDPTEVYRWFMTLFIDAYDWVMVPNVYGMSQYADGGLMSSKPYFSGSNYLMKMGDYRKGKWQQVWDGLFWRFISVHRETLKANPRIRMLVGSYDRMSSETRNRHLEEADKFIGNL